jgi:apolipoprotein N-acyltransferase
VGARAMTTASPLLEAPGRLPRIAAALVSAVCMVLACPTYDLWWLGLVGWVPWLWAMDGVRPRAAFFYGWITGTVTVFWGFFWMSELLTKFAGFPLIGALPLTLLFAMWQGSLWGFAAGLASLVHRRSGAPLLVVVPVAWVVTEALLPNIFPIYMALAWCWQPLWIQAAEIGGVTMVSGLMLAINTALYRVLRSRLVEGRLEMRAVATFLALVVGVPTYGALRIAQVKRQMEAAPKLKFAVVQGNMSIFEMRQMQLKVPILRKQQHMTAALQEQGAQIALWGETAYPNPRAFTRQSTTDVSEKSAWKVQRGFDIPIVFGTVTRDTTGQEKYPFNTAIMLDGEGRIAGMYDKVYRLVFGEYIPVVDPDWYLEKVPNASHIAQGKGASVLELGEWRLGPFICYEDILPRFVRDAANQRVHVFVNLTNDAWFGKTDEPWQHLGLGVFRTVEHRKGLVRSVNTGVSTYVDPTGAIVQSTRVTDPDTEGPQSADGFLAEVPMMSPDEQTIYGRTGEGWNALMIGALVALGWRRRETC